MSEYQQPEPYRTEPLTRELAKRCVGELTALASQIPGVEYTPEDVLAEQKGERQLLGKWEHSLVVLDGDQPIGLVMGYERQAEGNDQYPVNTLYLSELAVAPAHQGQGIARRLLRAFFQKNNALGFQHLDGELNYSIQTNSADWNQGVVDLYRSFGFAQRATKLYPNRTDVVLGARVSDIGL